MEIPASISQTAPTDDLLWGLIRSAENCEREIDQFKTYAEEHPLNEESYRKLQQYIAVLRGLQHWYLWSAEAYNDRDFRVFQFLVAGIRGVRRKLRRFRPTTEPTLEGRRSRG
jgi:hypothetical protein